MSHNTIIVMSVLRICITQCHLSCMHFHDMVIMSLYDFVIMPLLYTPQSNFKTFVN
jgi:hypothetical protein